MPCRTPLDILPRHLDFYGHVNNAAYAELFEEGRWDLISRQGFGREKVQALGLGPVVLELNIRFKREVRAGEKVEVETWTSSAARKVFVVSQKLFNAQGVEAASAEVTLGLLDLTKRRLVEIPEDWKKAFGIGTFGDVDKPGAGS